MNITRIQPNLPSRPHGNRTRLLASVLIDNIGNGIHTLAIGKLLYDATGSVWAFGASILVEYILAMLLQVVAGSMVDRGNPRIIAAWTDVLRGACVLAAGAAVDSAFSLVFLWLTVVVINVGKPFARSASFALIPLAISEAGLGSYFSLASAFFQAGQLLGIAAAGPLLAWCGGGGALAVDGATYILSAVLVLSLRVAPTPSRASDSATQPGALVLLQKDWVALLQMLRVDRVFFWNLMLASGDFIAVSFLNLALVPLVAKRLGGDPLWLTVLDGSFAFAAMLAAGLSRYLRRTTNLAATFLGVEALCLALLAVVSQPSAIVFVYLVLGTVNALSLSLFMTSLYVRSSGAIKGRVAALRHLMVSAISACLIPIAAALHTHSLAAGLLGSAAVLAAFAAVTKLIQARHGLAASIILAVRGAPPDPETAPKPQEVTA